MILDDIASHIIANSTLTLGGTSGTLALTRMLDSQPDQVTVLYETGGAAPEHSFSTGDGSEAVYEKPSIQALTRSGSYQGARRQAETVYTVLDGAQGTIGGTRYLSISALQSPFSIGTDEQGRHLVSVNFEVKKEVS